MDLARSTWLLVPTSWGSHGGCTFFVCFPQDVVDKCYKVDGVGVNGGIDTANQLALKHREVGRSRSWGMVKGT